MQLRFPASCRVAKAQLLSGLTITAITILLSACASAPISPNRTPSSLDPHGPAAARIADLWWLMVTLGTLVFVLVLILMIAAIMRHRRATSETAPSPESEAEQKWLIWGGIVLPLVIIAVVFGNTIYTLASLSNPAQTPLTINVVGWRWWWQIDYTAQGFATANELHIPVGTPVQLVLQSGDVIHSLWIPQLHGKMDLIPGRVNVLTIQADEAGVYRGECAEFCGLQHAHMGFMVVAETQAAFDQWIAAQKQAAPAPNTDLTKRGQTVFLKAGCANCHTIGGLDDSSVDASVVDLGPDLTHLSSRLTIAGASRTANPGNLAGWIMDAQHIKPGSLMPPMRLDGDDLQALLAYLQTLK